MRSKLLRNELDNYMQVDDGEEPLSEEDALEIVLDFADEGRCEAALARAARKEAIRRGWYREVTDDELEQTVVSHGRKYAFSLDRKKYVYCRTRDPE